MNLIHLNICQCILGAVLAFVAAFLAWRFKLLTLYGAIAAFLMGTLIFGLGGWNWALILIIFFITSSGLSLIFKTRKQQAEKMYAKSSKRDHSQVLANGGVGMLLVLLHFVMPDNAIPWICYCAAMAAANADTWATELGILNRRRPVMINNGRPAEPGTSGAISLTGTLASAGGSGLIALLACLLWPASVGVSPAFWSGMIVFLAGISGSLVDSLLGATLQAIYYCPSCQKETEKHPVHGCGTPTTLLRGKTWLDNEWVNFACTCSAAVLAALFYGIMGAF